MPQLLASLELLEIRKLYAVLGMMKTDDIPRAGSRKLTRRSLKVDCSMHEMRICLNPTILPRCIVPFNHEE